MFSRFACGLYLVVLVGFVGYKVWKETTLSPQAVVEVNYAHELNLSGKGVTVAVLDEGFDPSHHLFKNQISPYRYNTNNKTRDISETLIFENGQYKFESHGTHVTGIISSFAPEAKIIPIKIGGFGGDQAFVKALQIAGSTSAHIVNISMRLSHTGREISPNVQNALIQLAQAGKLIIIAAGNEGMSLMQSAYTTSLVELAHDPQIGGRLLLVGASSYKKGVEVLATFSNYPGNNAFGFAQRYFIVAPGEHIHSSLTGGLFGEKSGTSMAAPIIAGTASLLKQAFPHFKAEDIALLLVKSARTLSLDGKALPRGFFGAGIVNFRSALEQGQTL